MFENKKVLILCTTDNMVTQFLLPHIKHMQEYGNMVDVACNKSGKWFSELTQCGLKVFELPCKRNPLKFSNIKAYKVLKKIVKDNEYDLIYCQQPVGGVLGRLVGHKFKIPVIYTAHGFFFYKGSKLVNKIVYKSAEKFLAKYTDVLVTINEEDYAAAKKMKKENVYKISGIGFDKNKYQNQLTKEQARKSLGIDEDCFVVCTVAEFIKRKNYDTMLKAIAQMKGKIKFLACGTGVLFEKMQKKVNKMGLSNKVQLLGYRKDVNNIMVASDAFFLPSHQEGLTLSIIEAMNFGLPVVTSDVRGNRDLIVDQKGGFVVAQNDYIALAQKLTILQQNRELAHQYGMYNKQNVGKYSLENVIKELDEVYSNIHFN